LTRARRRAAVRTGVAEEGCSAIVGDAARVALSARGAALRRIESDVAGQVCGALVVTLRIATLSCWEPIAAHAIERTTDERRLAPARTGAVFGAGIPLLSERPTLTGAVTTGPVNFGRLFFHRAVKPVGALVGAGAALAFTAIPNQAGGP